MATTVDQLITAQDAGNLRSLRAGVFLHPQGTIVYEASGYSTNVISTTANPFMGIAMKACDNTGGSAGDLSVEFFTSGAFELVGTGFTQADAGKLVYGIDNFSIHLTATSRPPIGRCVEFISTTVLLIEINPSGLGI